MPRLDVLFPSGQEAPARVCLQAPSFHKTFCRGQSHTNDCELKPKKSAADAHSRACFRIVGGTAPELRMILQGGNLERIDIRTPDALGPGHQGRSLVFLFEQKQGIAFDPLPVTISVEATEEYDDEAHPVSIEDGVYRADLKLVRKHVSHRLGTLRDAPPGCTASQGASACTQKDGAIVVDGHQGLGEATTCWGDDLCMYWRRRGDEWDSGVQRFWFIWAPPAWNAGPQFGLPEFAFDGYECKREVRKVEDADVREKKANGTAAPEAQPTFTVRCHARDTPVQHFPLAGRVIRRPLYGDDAPSTVWSIFVDSFKSRVEATLTDAPIAVRLTSPCILGPERWSQCPTITLRDGFGVRFAVPNTMPPLSPWSYANGLKPKTGLTVEVEDRWTRFRQGYLVPREDGTVEVPGIEEYRRHQKSFLGGSAGGMFRFFSGVRGSTPVGAFLSAKPVDAIELMLRAELITVYDVPSLGGKPEEKLGGRLGLGWVLPVYGVPWCTEIRCRLVAIPELMFSSAFPSSQVSTTDKQLAIAPGLRGMYEMDFGSTRWAFGAGSYFETSTKQAFYEGWRGWALGLVADVGTRVF